jgi:histone demethylase JARID1
MTSNGMDDAPPPNPSMNPLRKFLNTQSMEATLPPLVFDYMTTNDANPLPSIPTQHSTPRTTPPRLRPRLYDLEEAPTFYPTWEEFADPLGYIQWVGDAHGGNGKAFGIVKIVPPVGWDPDFVLNQDVSRESKPCAVLTYFGTY